MFGSVKERFRCLDGREAFAFQLIDAALAAQHGIVAGDLEEGILPVPTLAKFVLSTFPMRRLERKGVE